MPLPNPATSQSRVKACNACRQMKVCGTNATVTSLLSQYIMTTNSVQNSYDVMPMKIITALALDAGKCSGIVLCPIRTNDEAGKR
jgi:hypothetical protein